MKEKIKLEDFVNDISNAFKLNEDEFKPDISFRYFCPQCSKNYCATDKFCSQDGTKIKKESFEFLTEETKDNIVRLLYDLSCTDIPENFPYEYVDSIEKRGDGDGYYNHLIFKRKSDDKFFYYCSYDGRLEEKSLEETKKIVKTTWDFEEHFD